MTEIERIRIAVQALVSLGVAKNQDELGKLMGYKSKSAFSQILTGKVPIPGNFIDKLCALDNRLMKMWIVNEVGNVLRNKEQSKQVYIESKVDSQIVKEQKQSYLSPSINNHRGVPYYDVDFIGGFDTVTNDSTLIPSFYIDFGPFNDADYWVNVTGKSMSPFISHGDLIAIKKVESWRDFLLFGEIYAVITDEFRTIKIVGKGKNDNFLSLIPYSKSVEFSTQEIPKKLITHVFRVKGSIKKFF